MRPFALDTTCSCMNVSAQSRSPCRSRRSPRGQSASNAIGGGRAARHDRDQPATRVGGRPEGCCRTAATPIDAAVTAAAVLAVVEPSMTGIGGDLFAIVYDAKTKTLHGLNASGRSAYAATPEEFAQRDLDARCRPRGVLSVNVPGVVDGWYRAALEVRHDARWRRRSRRRSTTHATATPVSRSSAAQWRGSEPKLAADPAAAATFLPGGQPPRRASFREPEARRHARTDRATADATRSTTGPIARAIVADMRSARRPARGARLRRAQGGWVEPISTNYRGYDVYEMPPNTQGFVALEMLNILEGFDMKAMGHNSADYLHAARRGEADRVRRSRRLSRRSRRGAAGRAATLISKDTRRARRTEIDPRRATYTPASSGAHRRDAGQQISPASIAATRST